MQFLIFACRTIRRYNTADLYFKAQQPSSGELEMTLNAGAGRQLVYHYQLPDDQYMLDWQVRSRGMEDIINSETGLQWEMNGLRQEKNRENENQYTRLKYSA
ncbi:MAG: hypothetical protein U5L96_08505 [Owenweeksia sp.]|nr:hypothetical protein [Owenweeksia sp.]